MKVIRVFPRQTRATPCDELAAIDRDPGFFDEADEVHISVAFSYDLPKAEYLASAWKHVAPVKIGGPATGEHGGDFVPGMYLKGGYVITSRGCPNRCWFCSVWRREGETVRELPITEGWNILDDNLLACSENHIRSVFAMLAKQKERPQFTGGLEAKRLQPWHVEELLKLKPKQMFFAYDTEDDLEPLQQAGKLLQSAGFKTSSHCMRAYVLCGFPKDTTISADHRMSQTLKAGFMPMAMLYRDAKGETSRDWRIFQREWARPAIIARRTA